MLNPQKKEHKPPEKFLFDLELQIKENPSHGTKLIEKAEKHVQEIKKALREGVNESDFDNLGILLHGYTALEKVLKKTNQ